MNIFVRAELFVSTVLAVALITAPSFGAEVPITGAAANGSPAWHLQKGFPDPLGRGIVDEQGRVTVPPRPAAAGRRGGPAVGNNFGCSHSTVCTRTGGPDRQETGRVTWAATMGYTFSYPFPIPPPAGAGGVPAVALDSKGNVWALQRKPKGEAQVFKFDKNGKLLLTVSPDALAYQQKGHGVSVDPNDNFWITDTTGATATEISPDGKVLKTIGTMGKRGDWDEAKGQHLLWQPTDIAFSKDGDMYIGEGHANESPNDTDSDDPSNVLGASRVLHFDRNGTFINQWYGDDVGQGKFEEIHGMAVDPRTGDVWLGDREQYRIVVYTGDGKFVKTIQMRNLVCDIAFDPQGNPWITSGQDGQVLKIDHNGKVLGAIGGGMGIEPGQFIEAAFFDFDKLGNIYVGDTSIGRVAKLSPPAKKAAK